MSDTINASFNLDVRNIAPISDLYEKEQNSEKRKELNRKYDDDENMLWCENVHAPIFTDSELFWDEAKFYSYDERDNTYGFYGEEHARWYAYQEGFGWYLYVLRKSSKEVIEYLEKELFIN